VSRAHTPSPAAAPTCSVIVPSYRAEATIRACLASLRAQDIAEPFEVIVADSSPDGTADTVRAEFPDVRLLAFETRTEPARARNAGAAAARGEILAFLDADCVAPSDWLSRLVAPLRQGYDAAGGAITNANTDSAVSWAGYICEFREFLPGGPPRDAGNLTLGNAAYRRAVFEAAGGLPEGCFPQEDQVFHDALRRRQARIRLDPAVAVAHVHRTVPEEFLEHQRRIGRANAHVVRRLGLPGASLARRRALAWTSLPALVPLRFVRTLAACRSVGGGLVLRRPEVAWLCWRGMWAWGRGFAEGAA
jgi:glycosyltransferase involved in cell wall biosynthesis